MSEKYKYESGAIHLDHHKELHIEKVTSDSVRDLMRDFFERDAEDVDVYDEIAEGLAEIQEDIREAKSAKRNVGSTNGIAGSPEELIRQCILLLMNERISVKKGGKEVEEELFSQQNHWQAIYRILVDKKFCKDSDFDGFDIFINKVMPSRVNAPYRKQSVKQISQTDFNKPFDKWKFDAETSGTLRPFERMKAVAQRFLEILEEKGL